MVFVLLFSAINVKLIKDDLREYKNEMQEKAIYYGYGEYVISDDHKSVEFRWKGNNK